MASIDFDTLGDIHKSYEQNEAGRAIMPGLPVLARLDGVGFHNFTKGLKRPYDESMSQCMARTAKYLLDYFKATVVYTQSDEITLGWLNEDSDVQTKLMFSGKYQKLCSTMAARASVAFNKELKVYLPQKIDEDPVFDCRVWQVPTVRLAAENFLWRELDATKNSITMAASAYYSHTELHKVSGKEKKDMLIKKGINWNEYPDFFKKGVYFRKESVQMNLTPAEIAKIPEKFRPTGPVLRNVILEIRMPKITSVTNCPEVLFKGQTPIIETQPGVLNENSKGESLPNGNPD